MKKRMLSMLLAIVMVVGLIPGMTLTASATDSHTNHCVCGKESSETVEGHTHSASMPEWKGTATLSNDMSAGYYYLTANVQLTAPWTPADGTVLCLNGHTITAPSNSYAMHVSNKFTLTDCSDDKTEGYLDAAYLWHVGEPEETTAAQNLEYDLTGGVITGAGGTNTRYGAIYVGGTFEMYGGNIAGNDETGGVMAVSGSKFTMYGGKVCGNYTTGNGGGVHLFGSTFTMHGGEIAYNRAGGTNARGGGVYVCNRAEFIMSGQAKVVGNYNRYGGGIYVDTGSTAELSGNASVAENKSGGVDAGAIYNSSGGTVILKDNASVTKNAGNGIYGFPGSTITLNGCTGTIHVTNNTKNGIQTSGTLTLNGCADNPGSILISGNTVRGVESNGSLTMSNSTISENKAGGMKVDGSFAISDSRISGNIGEQGAGIYIAGDGSVTNTQITGNKACGNNLAGGGVYIGPNGKARISGGEITGNSADRWGGGIWLYSSNNLQLAGAVKITDNIVNGSEENLFFFSPEGKKAPIVQIGVTDEAGNTEYLTGDAKIGVSHISTPTEDTPLALTKENGADYSRYFFSDKPAYGIYNGDDNKVMLGVNKTITYDANGGSGTQAEDAYPINGTFTLPESTTFTPPGGKKFKGWSLSENGEIIESHKISGDTIFYAIWYDYIVEVTGVEAATGLVYNGSPQQGYTADNIVSGVYIGAYTATYVGANGTSYGPSNTAPTNAGDYTVTLSIPADATYGGYEYAGESAPVAFTIGKAASSVDSTPTAINPTYNGTAQDLVTAGEATGGEMQYAVGGDAVNAPIDGWSTTVPTGKNAGTYYVWYKVLGDSNHNDSAPVCIEAKIEKAILDVSAKNYLLAVNSPAPDLTSADAYSITGFVGSETSEVVTGAPVLSYAFNESPDMSKEGYYFIEVNTEGMSAVNYDFNAISGELQVVTCVHEFTEFSVSTSADGTVSILAKCRNNCAEFAQPAAIITITAPDNAVYEQGLDHNVSLMHDSQVQVDSEDIVYSGDPVDAGIYTASITYGGKTASVTYTVAPRPLTIKADNKSVYVGESEPAYTYTVTGWEENYDAEDPYAPVLTGLTADCAGADLTKAGTYEITISGTPVVEDSDGNDVSSNYAFTMENGTLTVSTRPSSGGSSNTTSKTEKNEDGSTTTTTTNKTTGTVTETTKYPDGSSTTVETKKDGSATETSKTADGTTGTVVTDKDGNITEVSAKVPASAAKDAEKSGEAVQLPIEVEAADDAGEAVEIEVDVPTGGAKVEIPVEGVTSGTVIVVVNADGTEEIVKTSTMTENGVVVTLEKDATIKVIDNSKDFGDVADSFWAGDSIDFVTAREIFGGISATTFNPNGTMTRQAMWMVLARMSGETPANMAEARDWAVENGISDGSNPTNAVTRQQFVTMLWRWHGEPESDHSVDHHIDAHTISSYAEEAVAWAVEHGIKGGYDDGTLKPHGTATRAHVATFIQRFYENVLQ